MHSQNYQIQYIYSSFFSKKCTSLKDSLLQIKTWLNPKICQFNPIWYIFNSFVPPLIVQELSQNWKPNEADNPKDTNSAI